MALLRNQTPNDRRILGIPVSGDPTELTPSLVYDNAKNQFVWLTKLVNFSELLGSLANSQIPVKEISLDKLKQDSATDNQVLTWDNSLLKWKPTTISGAGMSDLEFIQSKILSNNYFQVSGNINGLNDTIEHIIPNNKTAFLIEAKITLNTNTGIVPPVVNINSVNQDQVVADLLINLIVKDKTMVGVSSRMTEVSTGGGTGAGFSQGNNGKFNVLGLSLVGDGIKKIEIKNVLDSGSAFATMSGYLIDT